ncbi:hypothetical protein Tco_1486485, partial [Tanacetum coccineum]
INGSNIGDDGEWRDSGSSGDANATIFRIHRVLNTNRYLTHGRYDDCIDSFTYDHLLPSMGWHVLQPNIRR